jgi:hypothetical protein
MGRGSMTDLFSSQKAEAVSSYPLNWIPTTRLVVKGGRLPILPTRPSTHPFDRLHRTASLVIIIRVALIHFTPSPFYFASPLLVPFNRRTSACGSPELTRHFQFNNQRSFILLPLRTPSRLDSRSCERIDHRSARHLKKATQSRLSFTSTTSLGSGNQFDLILFRAGLYLST